MILLRDYVEVLNPSTSGDDSHGNPSDTWAGAPLREPAQVSPPGGTQGSSSENLVGGDVVVNRMRITLSPITSATSRSRIVWHGDTYEVVSEVVPITDRAGRVHHHVGIIEKVSG